MLTQASSNQPHLVVYLVDHALSGGTSSHVACKLVLLLATFGVGCQGQQDVEGRFVLSGTVTYDGAPLPSGTIEFFPTDLEKKPAGAEVIDGKFQMDRALGPELGQYQVVILAERPSGRREPADEGSSQMVEVPEQYIPAVYNSQTKLSVEVTGDRDDLNFALEKTQRRRR